MESIPAEKKTTGQKPIIDLRSVTKVYRVGSVDVHALRGIDLQIMPGEFCCIIGRSGSGKSTLLNMLAGLEPVTSGEVVINGKHLERMNQSELILFRQKYVGSYSSPSTSCLTTLPLKTWRFRCRFGECPTISA